MTAQILQTVLVAMIVSVSALVGARHVAPGPFRSLQSSLARMLGRPQRSGWQRALGRWLQPPAAKQGACGSGLGCASCGGCGVSSARSADSSPLKFRSTPPRRP